MNLLRKTAILFVFPMCLLFAQQALGAKIIKVKGKKVFVSLDGGSAKKGDRFYTLGPKGKKRGIISIVKAKGNKAIARLRKGKAKKGWAIQKRMKKVKKVAAPPREATKEFTKRDERIIGRSFLGGMAGFSINNMDATIAIDTAGNTEDTSMTGTGFGLKGMYDYGLWQQIWFRGLVGIENFAVTGTDEICGDNADEACDLSISYISIDLWGRYLFSTKKMRFWVGLGFDLLIPSSEETNSIKDISSTSVIAFGGGLDWFLSRTLFIPIQIDYGLYPPSATVTASSIGLSAGVGFSF